MLPILKKPLPESQQHTLSEAAPPSKFLSRGRINFCLGVNTVVLFGLVWTLSPHVEQWIPLLGSIALLAVAVVSVINITLDTAGEHYGNACYRLQLSEQRVQQLKKELSEVQRFDEVTGCYNEAHLREELSRLIAMSKRADFRYSALSIRIDQYLDVLGRHGQRGSNDLLEVFANILKRSVREVDTVARVEDEHFIVLLSDSVDADAMVVCNRMADLTHQIRIDGDPDLRVTISMGVTTFAGYEEVDDVINHSNVALQFAIDEGGDRIAGYLHKEHAAA